MQKTAEFKWLGQTHRFKVNDKQWLDMGCGENKHKGFIGVDKRRLPNVDCVHDLESFPWPFEKESISVILASQIIEHIKPWLSIDFMNECWRILEFDGLLVLITPYGGSERSLQDPTHCNPWIRYTPFYFIPGNVLYDVYKPKQWKCEVLTFNAQHDIGFAFRKIPDITKEEEDRIRKTWKYVYMAAPHDEKKDFEVKKVRI